VSPSSSPSFSISPSVSPSSSPSPSASPPVSDGASIVGQIFKNPQDNINSIYFTAKSGQSQTELDNLETGVYANDVALQAVWAKAGTDEAVRELTIKATGSDMSMKLDASKANGEWAAAITNMPISTTPINMTNAIISFKFRQNNTFANLRGSIFIKDSGGNKSVVSLVVDDDNVNEFVTFSIPIESFTSGTPADITDITTIGFEVDKLAVSGLFYVDSLTFIISAGIIRIKLWKFGTDVPVAGVAKLSDATQYETLGDLGIDGTVVSQIDVPLQPGKRHYHIHEFSAGLAFEKEDNAPLVVNNYYALTFHHVDEDVIFYGNNEGRLSDSGGYSFTAPDESSVITATGDNENLQFYLYTVKPVYVVEYHLHMVDVDGAAAITGLNSEWTTIINRSGEPFLIDEHHHYPISEFEFTDMVGFMGLGDIFETKYVPGTDDINSIVQEIIYLHQEVEILT
jgi:hypothetical protein